MLVAAERSSEPSTSMTMTAVRMRAERSLGPRTVCMRPSNRMLESRKEKGSRQKPGVNGYKVEGRGKKVKRFAGTGS